MICDFPHYPEWVSAVRSVEVLEEYEDGYASQVRFIIDAGVVQDEYMLAYEYAEDISRIEWDLVGAVADAEGADRLVRHRGQRRRDRDGDVHAVGGALDRR